MVRPSPLATNQGLVRPSTRNGLVVPSIVRMQCYLMFFIGQSMNDEIGDCYFHSKQLSIRRLEQYVRFHYGIIPWDSTQL